VADSLKRASFGLNSGGLSPTMNSEASSQLILGSIPVMNTAASTLFWSQFGRPQPDNEFSSSQLVLGSIPAMKTAPLLVSIRAASAQ
jgi:hypothetical protein